MLVIYNDSHKNLSKEVRGIVGRYCWKISRDLWIWPKASIRFEIENELKNCYNSLRVIFLWKDSSSELGYRYKLIGGLKSRQNKFGLFNHFKKFTD